MIDIQNSNYCPSLEEICEYVRNQLFYEFCLEMDKKYNANYKVEFSKCSWELGWNIKFKHSGKSLCTVYPKENYFTVLLVVGKKEKEQIEALLPESSPEIQKIYHQTKEGNGQRWLMIDLEDAGAVYNDLLRFIEIRSQRK